MTRPTALTYAAAQYTLVRGQLGISSLDDETGIKTAIDNAFLRAGVAVPDLATAECDPALDLLMLALLRFYVLDLCREACVLKVDVNLTDDGVSKRYGQQATALEKLQEPVAKEIDRLSKELLTDAGGEYGSIFIGDLEADAYGSL